MKYHYDVEQRTDEWHALRLGRITGTSFTTMANGKPATIETLCEKTAAERITGVSSDSGFTNEAMERGIELEEQAFLMYERDHFCDVKGVGFVELDEFAGCSPDGLVGDDGGIEIKCPEQHTHLRYMTCDTAWKKYLWQLQGFLWVTGRKWIDFVSFNPDFPREAQLVVRRIEPRPVSQEKLTKGYTHCRGRILEIMEAYNANIPS